MKFYLTKVAVLATVAMTSATAMADHEEGRRNAQRHITAGAITPDLGPAIATQAPPGRLIATLAQEIEQQACDLYYELASPTFRHSTGCNQLRQQAALLYYRAKRIRQTAGTQTCMVTLQRDVARLDLQFHALNDLVVATIRQTRHQEGPNPRAAGHARLVLDAMDVTVHELKEITDQLVVAPPTRPPYVARDTHVFRPYGSTWSSSRSVGSHGYHSVATRSSPWSNLVFGGRGWSIRFGR